MVQPTNPSTPINQPIPHTATPLPFPSPYESMGNETAFFPPPSGQQLTNDATTLSALLNMLPSDDTTDALPQPALSSATIDSNIITATYNCLVDFLGAYAANASNPNFSITNIKGYRAFYTLLQGGADAGGNALIQPSSNGQPLFALSSDQSTITSPAGLIFSNPTPSQMSTNQTILQNGWNDGPGNDYPSPGFLSCALDLASGGYTPSNDNPYAPLASYFNPSAAGYQDGIVANTGSPPNTAFPPTPPSPWNGTTCSDYIMGQSGVCDQQPAFLPGNIPNVAYFLNITLVLMKMYTDPNIFSTLTPQAQGVLQPLFATAIGSLLSMSKTSALDPATKAILTLFNGANGSLYSPTINPSIACSYFQGKDPTSPFYPFPPTGSPPTTYTILDYFFNNGGDNTGPGEESITTLLASQSSDMSWISAALNLFPNNNP